LSWQLGTALSRLFVQVWPLILIAVFTGLRRLDSFITDAAPSKSHKKAGR
jgi:ABC-type proline/glycine betaine transport system permease subunit